MKSEQSLRFCPIRDRKQRRVNQVNQLSLLE